jgi:hypothetical protein
LQAPVHDFLHILGLQAGADAEEIRRASRRQLRRSHPDFEGTADLALPSGPVVNEAAVDFVAMQPIVERMQTAFFGKSS